MRGTSTRNADRARPLTGDVGNYTSSLGILHDDIGKDNFGRKIGE
jgi:hypothetical protein